MSEEMSEVEKAEAILAKIEAANKHTEELLERQERLRAKEILSGRSEAGYTPPKAVDPYEDPREYAKAVMEGKVDPLKAPNKRKV